MSQYIIKDIKKRFKKKAILKAIVLSKTKAIIGLSLLVTVSLIIAGILGGFFVNIPKALATPVIIVAFEPNELVGDEVTFNATTNNANLNTATLSRGAGITPWPLVHGFSSRDFVVNGTKDNAISSNEYFQLTISAKANYKVSLSSIDLNLRRSSTGPKVYQWQYSLDNFVTSGIDIGAQGSYSGSPTDGLAMPQINLSGVANLQNVTSGTTITFRLYAWGATGGAGTFAIGRLAGNDLVFAGNVNLITHALTYTASANGSITGASPQTVNHGSNGTEVTAVPDSNYYFTSWSDGVLTASRTDTNVIEDISVTANFAINTHALTYTASANGSITGASPQTVNHGSNGTEVTAVPDSNYYFTSWSDGVLTASRTDTNVIEDISVTANFAINTHALTYTASANGSITGASPQTVNHGSNGTEVTAVPDSNYYFTSWSDGVLTASRTDTNVIEDISVTANFAIDTHTLSYTPLANGSITGASPQTVNHGSNGTEVTAVPDSNYYFTSWSDGVLTASRTDTNVIEDISVTANFAINTHALTYTASANGSITGASPQTVNHGSNGTEVTAVPDSNYYFTSWSDGVLTASRTDTNVIEDISVTANFAINNTGGGGAGGGGYYTPPEPALIISELQSPSITTDTLVLTWVTNFPSSSYVIYSAEGEAHSLDMSDTSGFPPKYGYAHATPEIDTESKVVSHLVTITGLNPFVTYYFRTVSRGSLAISGEYKTMTPVLAEDNVVLQTTRGETIGNREEYIFTPIENSNLVEITQEAPKVSIKDTENLKETPITKKVVANMAPPSMGGNVLFQVGLLGTIRNFLSFGTDSLWLSILIIMTILVGFGLTVTYFIKKKHI